MDGERLSARETAAYVRLTYCCFLSFRVFVLSCFRGEFLVLSDTRPNNDAKVSKKGLILGQRLWYT